MNSATTNLSPNLRVADAVKRCAVDVVYILDRSGNIVDGNDRFWADLGNGGHAVQGHPMLNTIPEDERTAAERTWDTILRHRRTERSVRKMRTPLGQVRVYSVMESPIESSGAIEGVLGIARDITEEAAIEDKLWNQQEHREAALEYAVRASMGLVKGYVFSMQKLESMPEAKRAHFSKVIAEEIDTMGRSINNLLFSRNVNDLMGESDIFDVRAIIGEVIQSQKAECERREIVLQFTPPAKDVSFYGHDEAIRRTVSNIVEFCILRLTHMGSIVIGIADCVEYIEVKIEDRGAPVNNEMIEGLLKPWHSQGIAEAAMAGSRFDIEVARLLCDSLGGGLGVEAVSDNGVRS